MFFDFPSPRISDFVEKATKNVGQIFLYYHLRKLFFRCLNWLITPAFRIYFGKTLVAFDVDGKITQSVAKISM